MPAEFDFIRWIRERTAAGSRVKLGPGDDCAILSPSPRATLATTDMLMEGVDFVLAECGARAVGRKAMAVNLSDIAAMAGVPTAALVSVCLPSTVLSPSPPAGEGLGVRGKLSVTPLTPSPSPAGGEGSIAKELYEGLKEVADRFHVPIIGGDTNSWAGGLVINVTVLGEPLDGVGPALRSGAKPGDAIFVTGPCGGSILGRHLKPTPRIREAIELARRVRLHSMIDISDGLSADLHHILEESGCGAVLQAGAIPVHSDAVALAAKTGRTPLEHALGDGEDFELIFTVPSEDAAGVLATGLAFLIGECVESGFWIEENGVRRELKPSGWQHSL